MPNYYKFTCEHWTGPDRPIECLVDCLPSGTWLTRTQHQQHGTRIPFWSSLQWSFLEFIPCPLECDWERCDEARHAAVQFPCSASHREVYTSQSRGWSNCWSCSLQLAIDIKQHKYCRASHQRIRKHSKMTKDYSRFPNLGICCLMQAETARKRIHLTECSMRQMNSSYPLCKFQHEFCSAACPWRPPSVPLILALLLARTRGSRKGQGHATSVIEKMHFWGYWNGANNSTHSPTLADYNVIPNRKEGTQLHPQVPSPEQRCMGSRLPTQGGGVLLITHMPELLQVAASGKYNNKLALGKRLACHLPNQVCVVMGVLWHGAWKMY